MSNASPRPRPTDDLESDEWLIDAARRAGHQLPNRERSAGTTSWRVLLNAGISEAEVLRLACAAAGTEAADFTRLSAAMGSLLAHGVALKHRVVPLGVHGGALDVATSNPRNPALERELAFAAKQRVRLHAASPSDIIRAQAVVYGTAYGTKAELGGSFITGAQAPASVMQPRPTPVARLTLQTAMPPEVANINAARQAAAPTAAPAAAPDMTDRLLAAAIAERASEAVLEPTPDGGLLVRLRIDGTLNDRFRIAETHTARLIHTLKQRAQLDVAETKQKQQGRATFESASGLVAVRVSVAPHRDGGERVVLRLVTSQGLLGLNELGYSSPEHHRLGQILDSKGLVIVAGLAGAGKTTTLYAAARELRKKGLPVSTVEEPIDYPLERIEQVQVSESVHLTLASAVISAIASHSGVIMVGAPLDAATMEPCVAEAAHGRLVLASLGTADMPGTLSQLFELYPDRAALAGALHGIVAQRLVRRLCSACAVPQSVGELPEQQQRLLYGLPAAKVRRPVGCAKCRTTGYLGRMAIVELIPMTGPLRAALAGGATPAELAQVAKENGMTTLWDSGLNRVLEGATSLAELLDTVPPPPEEAGEAAQEDIDALLKQLLGSSNMKADTAAAPVAAAAVAPVTRSAPPPTAPAPPAPPKAPPEPVKAPAPPPAVAKAPAAPRVTPTAPAFVAADKGMLRVLLVDDDAAARRVLAHALTQAGGIQVLQASDGVTALAFAKRLQPHIVLTEVALPGLDAIGLLAAFAEEETQPIVVVYTEQADGALDSWLLESGAREVLRRDLPAGPLARRLKELAAEG